MEFVPSPTDQLALGIWFDEDVRKTIGPVLGPIDKEYVVDSRRTREHLHEQHIGSINKSMPVWV